MKRTLILSAAAIAALTTVATTSSCLPRPPGLHGRSGVVVLPGHHRGPVGVPKPRVVRPPSPFSGALWVEPVWRWDGKRWVAQKHGYWAKPAPPGKAKGHYKNKHK